MGTTLWIILFAIIGLLLGVLIGWLIWGRQARARGERVSELEGQLRERDGQVKRLEAHVKASDAEIKELKASLAKMEAAASLPDDLTRIEGIGPKVQKLLQEAGITTMGQLAKASVDKLTEIVHAGGMAMADPGTWAEQAQLAAEGKWDELQVLQDELVGGRRV